MPVIRFESGRFSPEVKEKLLQALTDTAVEGTGIAKSLFFVSISELADDSVAAGGETVAELKSALEK